MALFYVQPKVLPGVPHTSLEQFSRVFDPELRLPAEGGVTLCKTVGDMEMPPATLAVLAFRRVDGDYQRLLTRIVMKLARCHVEHYGLSAPIADHPVPSRHPLSVAHKRVIFRMAGCDADQIRTQCILPWVKDRSDLVGDAVIADELRKLCKAARRRGIARDYEVDCTLMGPDR